MIRRLVEQQQFGRPSTASTGRAHLPAAENVSHGRVVSSAPQDRVAHTVAMLKIHVVSVGQAETILQFRVAREHRFVSRSGTAGSRGDARCRASPPSVQDRWTRCSLLEDRRPEWPSRPAADSRWSAWPAGCGTRIRSSRPASIFRSVSCRRRSGRTGRHGLRSPICQVTRSRSVRSPTIRQFRKRITFLQYRRWQADLPPPRPGRSPDSVSVPDSSADSVDSGGGRRGLGGRGEDCGTRNGFVR